jgi:hypothetical protein
MKLAKLALSTPDVNGQIITGFVGPGSFRMVLWAESARRGRDLAQGERICEAARCLRGMRWEIDPDDCAADFEFIAKYWREGLRDAWLRCSVAVMKLKGAELSFPTGNEFEFHKLELSCSPPSSSIVHLAHSFGMPIIRRTDLQLHLALSTCRPIKRLFHIKFVLRLFFII